MILTVTHSVVLSVLTDSNSHATQEIKEFVPPGLKHAAVVHGEPVFLTTHQLQKSAIMVLMMTVMVPQMQLIQTVVLYAHQLKHQMSLHAMTDKTMIVMVSLTQQTQTAQQVAVTIAT
jgi:hypothetical protein